jgi:hypothetical protein
VTELMAHGGMMPNYAPEATERKVSPRRKGVQQGVTLIMLGIILTSLFGVFSSYLHTPELFAAVAAIIGFVGGFLRLLYALIFEEGAPRQQVVVPVYMQPPHMPAQFNAQVRAQALPPAHSTPAPSYRPRQHTAEIPKPPSVTEGTTRLLDKELEPPREH